MEFINEFHNFETESFHFALLLFRNFSSFLLFFAFFRSFCSFSARLPSFSHFAIYFTAFSSLFFARSVVPLRKLITVPEYSVHSHVLQSKLRFNSSKYLYPILRHDRKRKKKIMRVGTFDGKHLKFMRKIWLLITVTVKLCKKLVKCKQSCFACGQWWVHLDLFFIRLWHICQHPTCNLKYDAKHPFRQVIRVVVHPSRAYTRISCSNGIFFAELSFWLLQKCELNKTKHTTFQRFRIECKQTVLFRISSSKRHKIWFIMRILRTSRNYLKYEWCFMTAKTRGAEEEWRKRMWMKFWLKLKIRRGFSEKKREWKMHCAIWAFEMA